MHKDQPPGLFDIVDHSVSYVIGLGLVIGLVLSVFIGVPYLLVREHFTRIGVPWTSNQ